PACQYPRRVLRRSDCSSFQPAENETSPPLCASIGSVSLECGRRRPTCECRQDARVFDDCARDEFLSIASDLLHLQFAQMGGCVSSNKMPERCRRERFAASAADSVDLLGDVPGNGSQVSPGDQAGRGDGMPCRVSPYLIFEDV